MNVLENTNPEFTVHIFRQILQDGYTQFAEEFVQQLYESDHEEIRQYRAPLFMAVLIAGLAERGDIDRARQLNNSYLRPTRHEKNLYFECCLNIANALVKQKRYEEAEAILAQTQELEWLMHDTTFPTTIFSNIAKDYAARHQIDKAKHFAARIPNNETRQAVLEEINTLEQVFKT